MGFQFQINPDVQFEHREDLLKKSAQCIPPLLRENVYTYDIVDLVKDEQKLEGIGTVSKNAELSSLPMRKGDRVILDFQTHHVGYFSIDIHSVGSPMDAPLMLQVRFAEVAAELAHTSEEYDGWLSKSWIQEEMVHIDVLPYRLALPRRYAFRFVELTVLDTSPKWQAVFSAPKIEKVSSADEKNRIARQFDDPMLQSIYDAGIRTLQDCMMDVFEDGPKRDRRLWLGDLRLQALANYASFKQNDLVKRCLYLFGAMTTTEGKISANVFTLPAPIPDDTFLFDYSLFFIDTLYDYLQEEDDQELLDDLFETARLQMDLSLRYVDEGGKLALTDAYPVFIDWSNSFDKSTAGQAVMIYTLRRFIWLAGQKGMDPAFYEHMLEKMEAYARTSLWNEEHGLFSSCGEYNIASQVWMVLADIFPQKKNSQIMKRMIETLFPIRNIATPYMYSHVVEALFHAELHEEAIQLMKGYWGKMIELGADTFWEAFDPDQPSYSPYGSPIISSYCHAWSCTPVYLLETYVLKNKK